MTLKDFHDKTPGQAPTGLPSKPGPMGGYVWTYPLHQVISSSPVCQSVDSM